VFVVTRRHRVSDFDSWRAVSDQRLAEVADSADAPSNSPGAAPFVFFSCLCGSCRSLCPAEAGA
jgi:hypothetical protein